MRATVDVIIELPEMEKLIDCPGVALEIPDKFLVLAPFWSAGKPISLVEGAATGAPTRPRVNRCPLGPQMSPSSGV
jgi:hypothetical protein